MAYVRTVADDEASGVVARIYEGSRKAFGGVFETQRGISLWPEALAMEGRRYETLMVAPSALSRGEKELIAIAVSAANRCHYCVRHHVAAAVAAGVARALAEAVAADHAGAALDGRTRALLDFAVHPRADRITRADVEALKAAGIDDREVVETALISGLFRDYNFRVSALGLTLEPWFDDGQG